MHSLAKETKVRNVLSNVCLLLGLQVPPLQERDSSCNVSRKLQSEKSILDQGTPDQKPLSGGPRQRPRRPGVLEWLLISQDQPKAKKSWVSPCLFISTSFLYSFLIFFFGRERDGGP